MRWQGHKDSAHCVQIAQYLLCAQAREHVHIEAASTATTRICSHACKIIPYAAQLVAELEGRVAELEFELDEDETILQNTLQNQSGEPHACGTSADQSATEWVDARC